MNKIRTLLTIATYITLNSSSLIASFNPSSDDFNDSSNGFNVSDCFDIDAYKNMLHIIGGNSHTQDTPTLTCKEVNVDHVQNFNCLEVYVETLKDESPVTAELISPAKKTSEEILKNDLHIMRENLKTVHIDLLKSQKNARKLHDQSEQYKNLAILGGITSSLAVGFIIFDKYCK